MSSDLWLIICDIALGTRHQKSNRNREGKRNDLGSEQTI